jgi:hypothetical protein
LLVVTFGIQSSYNLRLVSKVLHSNPVLYTSTFYIAALLTPKTVNSGRNAAATATVPDVGFTSSPAWSVFAGVAVAVVLDKFYNVVLATLPKITTTFIMDIVHFGPVWGLTLKRLSSSEWVISRRDSIPRGNPSRTLTRIRIISVIRRRKA